MIDLVLFVLGLCFGSFSNVVIHRLPKGESIMGRSRCPKCGKEIPFWLNIPLLSYLVLKGRCRFCGERISPVYPIVELLGGIIMVFSYHISPSPVDSVRYAVFLFLLLILSTIDLKHFILPDVLTIPGTVLGVVFSALSPSITLKSSILGLLSGSLGFLLIREVYRRIRGVEGLGLGDIKLMAMVGSYTGVMGVIGTVFFGSAVGVIYSIFLMLKRGKLSMKTAIPFGPFLSLGCTVFLILLYIGKIP